MKTTTLFLSAAFIALISISGTVYAHEEDGQEGQGGWHGHHHGSKCELHHLSEAKIKIFHEAMKASFEKDKALFEESHKLHRELRGIVKANTFDEKTYLSLNARLEEIHAQIHSDRTKAFASIAGQFTPEERTALLKLHHKNHHKHHHHMQHKASWQGHHEWRGEHETQSHNQPPMNEEQPSPQTKDSDYPPYSSR
jgi:Spy/CpxP family protein refolding chaperone